MKISRTLIIALTLTLACATTGDEGEGDKNLPNAGVGPFRKLATEEVRGLAPYVLDDAPARYREPAVLRESSATLLYAVARVNGKDVIVRTRANDARTFFGTSSHFGSDPAVVLEPDQPWEGMLSGPTLVRFGGDVSLYYAGDAGIGLARSADGLHFTKVPGPLLARDAAPGTWETTTPRAPSAFVSEDGKTLRMLYAAGNAIGEAESTDGIGWRRVRSGPVLVPSLPPAPGSLLPNEKPPFDTAAVGDPCVVTRTTPAGRFHVRVLYTGTGAAGASAIGFAARYGETGPLERQRVPVYAVGQHEAAPALLDLGASSYLYIQQDRREGSNASYVAIAAAVAPATLVLPETTDFPDAP
jgi:hypothetical protein